MLIKSVTELDTPSTAHAERLATEASKILPEANVITDKDTVYLTLIVVSNTYLGAEQATDLKMDRLWHRITPATRATTRQGSNLIIPA